jgi:hypothetical protein
MYALWNDNRIVLIAMVSALFVSHMPTPHPSSCVMHPSGNRRIVHLHFCRCWCYLWQFALTFPAIILFAIFTSLLQSRQARSQVSKAAPGTYMVFHY